MIDTCARCHEPLAAADETCPVCGYDIRQTRLPAVSERRAVVEWRGPVAGVIQGAALAGAGIALRYVLPKAAGFAARKAGAMAARRLLRTPASGQAVAKPAEHTLTYISETRIVRRVWTRR